MTSLQFAETKNACLSSLTLHEQQARYDAEGQAPVKFETWHQRSDCLKPHLDFQLTHDRSHEPQ